MNKISPKVSVIIPNYNHEHYLSRRIESVLSQTYQNIEVIILDDCSTDNSRNIIDGFVAIDDRIQCVYNEENSGSTFKQWKKGLTYAVGDYIWIAESDDYADVEFISKLLHIIEQDSEIGFVYSNSKIVDKNDAVVGSMADMRNKLFKTDKWNSSFVESGRQLIDQSLGIKCVVNNASSVLIRKTALLKSQAIDTSLRYAGDWLAYIRMAKYYKVAYLAESLNFYREHAQNASKSANYGLFYERICCMMEAYEISTDPKVRKDIFENLLKDYDGIMHNFLIKEKKYKIVGQYLIKIAKRNKVFFIKLQNGMLSRVKKRS